MKDNSKIQKPPLKWAQNKERIFITIDAADVKNEKI